MVVVDISMWENLIQLKEAHHLAERLEVLLLKELGGSK
jgi:hypothetical protein